MKHPIISTVMAVICILTFGFPKASASTIIIEIEAVVDSVSDNNNYLEGQIEVDDIITGYYIYESTTPDTNPSENVGDYEHDSTPYGIYLTVGGFEFQTDPCDVEFLVEIVNNNAGLDAYLLRSYSNLSLSNGTVVDHISWQLDDSTMTALSDDNLPTLPPVLSDWPSNIFNITGDTTCDGGTFGIWAHVTSAEIVPEPATVFLFGLGFLLIRKGR